MDFTEGDHKCWDEENFGLGRKPYWDASLEPSLEVSLWGIGERTLRAEWTAKAKILRQTWEGSRSQLTEAEGMIWTL